MSQRILLIEDNPISRKMVRIAPEAEGYTVIEAADGKTGLAFMTEETPDLVLQDLRLPDVNGFDLVSQLKEMPSGADIPILAPAKTDSALQRLKEMGVHLFSDDFGTGYSSLPIFRDCP